MLYRRASFPVLLLAAILGATGTIAVSGTSEMAWADTTSPTQPQVDQAQHQINELQTQYDSTNSLVSSTRSDLSVQQAMVAAQTAT